MLEKPSPEQQKSPFEAVWQSNREVLDNIYRANGEITPTALVAETNGSKLYANYAGVIWLVYENDSSVDDELNMKPTNPAVEVLAGLIQDGKVEMQDRTVEAIENGFRKTNDPFYNILHAAWTPLHAFVDTRTGEVLCYSMKVGTHPDAPTVLVSPDRVDLEKLNK